MDLSLLATLKDKLIHGKDFSQVMSYFFDHFGEDPDFMAMGEGADNSFLIAALLEIGREVFGQHVPLTDMRLIRLPEQQFIHGGLTMNGRLANVFYFEDIHVGLLALVLSISPSETRMARFSGRPLPPSRSPSLN